MKKSKSKKSPPKFIYRWVDKKILIVEDLEVNHMLIDRILQRTSANLIWAMDGEEAVELCQQHNDIDLVLMDIRLPKMNGYEATKRIRKFRNDLPIIAQTAYVMENNKHKVIDAGCNDLITKPIDKNILLDKVHKYIMKNNKM
ncbi:MAG: response regulator [Bacteroidota bacterium]|nr:response regulator [Bacteroidota bacterium]